MNVSPSTVIRNAQLVFPGEGIRAGSVSIEQGKIAAFNPAATKADAVIVDAGGQLLTPGLIDVHTHGIGLFFYEREPDEILRGVCEMAQYGATCLLPTLYRVMDRKSLGHLAALAAALPQVRGMSVPGFHLEGPFLKLPGAGAQTVDGDLGLLDELLAVCAGRVTAMSISPDTPNILPVIERLCENHIVPFITHTRASPEQTEAAIDAGARHATHFYDVFPVPEEAEPGVRPVGAVEVILADKRVTVDFIADGTHVHPAAIRAALAAKGWPGIILITDSNIGAGMPPGRYPTTWNYPVEIGPRGGARIADPQHPNFGTLAGSALTMDAGMRNLFAWLELPPEQIWAMGTINTAQMLGLDHKGRLAIGADADLVLWNDELHPIKTWVGGTCVWTSSV